MGNRDKFDNPLIKQLHDTGSSVIKQAKVALHENVLNFDEDPYLQDGTEFDIQKAALLDFTSNVITL